MSFRGPRRMLTIEPNFGRCFQLMRCDDPRLFQEWVLHGVASALRLKSSRSCPARKRRRSSLRISTPRGDIRGRGDRSGEQRCQDFDRRDRGSDRPEVAANTYTIQEADIDTFAPVVARLAGN